MMRMTSASGAFWSSARLGSDVRCLIMLSVHFYLSELVAKNVAVQNTQIPKKKEKMCHPYSSDLFVP